MAGYPDASLAQGVGGNGVKDLARPDARLADPETPAKSADETLPTLDRQNSVYFALGSYALDRDAMAVIGRHAEKLNGDARLMVSLLGYTDDLGSREYNNALCLKRAQAVEKALQKLDVSPKQIRISTRYGYEKSLDKPCRTDACRKRLRKVELRYRK